MSEVKADDNRIIESVDDLIPLYQGVGKKNAKSGIEIELAFFDPSKDDLPAMTLCQNRVLKNSAAQALNDHAWVHNEPTSELLEVASSAEDFRNIKNVISEANDKIKLLSDKALALGLKRSYFQELPEKTADDLLSRIVDVERYKIMYAPYRADMTDCVRYFAICKSNQVSVSPYNADHMLENVRRLYILAPFLFLLTDNSTGFCEGQPFSGHAGMDLRHKGLKEGRGGVIPYVFSARDGQEFVRAHINHAMNNPLFMYYDENAKLTGVPSGDWSVTFNSLKERGLNTASNFALGQSVLWPDVKIAALKDENGEIYSHRYEARMFGVGLHQHQTAYIITSALAFDDQFAASVDELLDRYGFSMDGGAACYDRVLEAYASARSHGGKFFDISYGTGSMRDFARDFAYLVEDMASRNDLEEDVQAILSICHSGCTDGKINRMLFPTLEDVMAFQKSYDPKIFEQSHRAARNVFQKEVAMKKASLGCSSACA